MSFTEQNGSADSLDESADAAAGMENGDPAGEESLDGQDEIPLASMVADEKRPAVSTTTMLMLGVLALGGLGVWAMMHRVSSASAAPVNVESVQAKKTINAFLDNGNASIRNMQQMLQSTEKIVQQFLNYPSMTQVPLSDLHMNPFRMKSPQPQLAESSAAEKRRHEEERVQTLKAVQALRLQSIMTSDARKACMINNTLYREGQQVEGFTIDKISADSVIVKSGVYRFELRMAR